jgi:chaperonin cofactor prefoldin
MSSKHNGKVKWVGELLFKIVAVGFIVWQINERFVSTTIEARVGPLEQKVEMLEKQLDKMDGKLDRLLERK